MTPTPKEVESFEYDYLSPESTRSDILEDLAEAMVAEIGKHGFVWLRLRFLAENLAESWRHIPVVAAHMKAGGIQTEWQRWQKIFDAHQFEVIETSSEISENGEKNPCAQIRMRNTRHMLTSAAPMFAPLPSVGGNFIGPMVGAPPDGIVSLRLWECGARYRSVVRHLIFELEAPLQVDWDEVRKAR